MGEDTEGLKRDIEDTRDELSRDVDALAEKVSPSRMVDRSIERTKGRLSDVKDRVMGSAEGAASSVSSAGGAVSDTASGAAETVKQKTQGNPLAAGLIAFGAGWLLSSLIPASKKEADLAGKAVDAAKEHGQPLARDVADVGSQIGQELKDRAQEAAESVKSTAADAATTVKDEGRSSAETVREEVRPSS
ncbi:MAG TPA: DUF3618 domain-containing protein [Jiangellaceae bacterium]|jgi:gas vesicle protein|nr:DUF3618 domain-containing protein [Jiangellaceae bacterium]